MDSLRKLDERSSFMNHYSIEKNKHKRLPMFIIPISMIYIFVSLVGCSKTSAESKGRVLSIRLSKSTLRPGDTLTIYTAVRNDGESKDHFLVAANVLYGEKTVYDSHGGKKSHNHEGDECLDVWIESGAQKDVGPFIYKIPTDARPGTYHVLVGLRKFPWEPLLMFRGARWCSPETTFEVR